ncbi:hypothetical protein FRX31_007726 [Thalictrum thalictroides]|uniref:Uncharacterized protein n=1 Tax=Thalictrum thalictroides TaxID=46969 RepID=A0A7J6WZ08_THATH|nr:hypothetical protein FRX31_007726 [Thalictrum thalictroides]
MAGMLPGVELARIRRISHRSSRKTTREAASLYQLMEPSRAMGETALIAQKKLEETLGLNTFTRCRCGTGDAKSNHVSSKNGHHNSTKRNWAKMLFQVNDEGKQHMLSSRKHHSLRLLLPWFNFR